MTTTVPLTGTARTFDLHSAAPTVPLTVHPLTLLSMTDEVSRIEVLNKQAKAADPAAKPRIPFGVLLGTSGKETSVHTAIDFTVTFDGGDLNTGKYHPDWTQAAKRVELIRVVLPTYDVIGIWTVGQGINAHLATSVTAQFLREKPKMEQSNVCLRPVLMVLDTKPLEGFRGVPLAAFEMSVPASGKNAADAAASSAALTAPELTRVEYRFESEETERIGVQQSADTAGVGRGNWVGPAANRFAGAVGNLHRRVDVITAYLSAVQAGKIAPDAELLRRIKQCATKLPRPEDAVELRGLLGEGVQDAVSTTIVSLMTKGSLGFAQLMEDTNLSLEAETRMFSRGH